MGVLLDTHTLIWWVTGDERISLRLRQSQLGRRDGMLAAQARAEGLSLVSIDPAFKALGVTTVW